MKNHYFFVFLSAFCLLVHVVCCNTVGGLPQTTFDNPRSSSGSCGESCTWRVDGETLIIEGTGIMKNASSTEQQWCSDSVKTVEIKHGITSIGEKAFMNCRSLTQVSIPNSVKSIENSAFSYCESLHNVTIPYGVESIGVNAFCSCSSLIEMIIPDSVTSIGGSAFYSCKKMTKFKFSSGLKSTGSGVLSYCAKLTEVIIPYGVETVASSCFWGCRSLPSLFLPDSVTSIGSTAFIECKSFSQLHIPDSVISIGENAFQDCSGLTHIHISSNLSSISKAAFLNCFGLTEVVIPESVRSIESSAFSGCTALSKLSMSEGVTSIGDSAFSSCISLTEVTIPSSVTSIGSSAFDGCSSLSSFEVKAGNKNYSSVEGVLFNKRCSALVRYPEGITNRSYTIPDCVLTIESHAFYGCKALVDLTIADSVLSIGERAFQGCSNLTNLIIGDSVSTIGEFAFYSCRSLTDVTIPESVTSVGWYAFYQCSNLTAVFYQGSESLTSGVFDKPNILKAVCVSPDYPFTSLLGVTVNSDCDECKTFKSMFNHCYKGSFVYGEFLEQKRKNATEKEKLAQRGCIHYECQNETGDLSQFFECEKRDCYQQGVCDPVSSECHYVRFDGWEELAELENACFEVVCVESKWDLKKRSNATEWEKKTSECEVFECDNATGFKTRSICNSRGLDSKQDSSESPTPFWIFIVVGVIGVGVIAAIIIIALLRVRIFHQKDDLAMGNEDDNSEMTMTIDGDLRTIRMGKAIGKGSFGIVWLANTGGLTLAVKEMERRGEEDVLEYEKEVSIMSQINSKYVVRVCGSSVTDSSFFIAMEYVPLGSLSSVFEKNSFSAYMRCRFMLDIAYGMEYLHEQGIVHRDLKPGNVLVSSLDPNADVLCKITDFGESRKGLDETHTMTMTRGVGSPYYMAPEMLRGDKQYTRAVDVYSFAIVCVELWNEQLPYSEAQFDTPFAFSLYVLDGHRPEIRQDCPADLTRMITTCWAAERSGRPPFSAVTKDLVCVVENIRQSQPAGVEHVKARKNATNQNRNKGSGTNSSTRPNDATQCEIPMDNLA